MACLLEHCVRLTYVDRVKCADGFPEALHALLPALPEARALLEDEAAATLARDADEAALARVVDPPEDAAGEAREPRPADAAFAADVPSSERHSSDETVSRHTDCSGRRTRLPLPPQMKRCVSPPWGNSHAPVSIF